jgi:hypothetical protein
MSDYTLPDDTVEHERVLEFYFSDILNEQKFELVYSNIIKHLNLKYKLIRHDLIKYHISKQHKNILPALLELT